MRLCAKCFYDFTSNESESAERMGCVSENSECQRNTTCTAIIYMVNNHSYFCVSVDF